jgi:hypothetical protein
MSSWSTESDANEATADIVYHLEESLSQFRESNDDKNKDVFYAWLQSNPKLIYYALDAYFTKTQIDKCFEHQWREIMVGVPLYFIRLLVGVDRKQMSTETLYPKQLPAGFPPKLAATIGEFIKTYRNEHNYPLKYKQAEYFLFTGQVL